MFQILPMPIYHIFCDESRQNKDRYMVLGGIIIPQENIVTFKDTMLKYRTDQNMTKELKWSKVSVQKIKEYKVFIDYQFALTNTNKAHFSSVIFDTHQINHNKHSDGDKEKGFTNFIINYCLIVLQEAT
jgi:hypothetical protein